MLREKIKVYLHIGLYKCASTSIQNNLINKIKIKIYLLLHHQKKFLWFYTWKNK